MAFGQASGPPATARQVKELLGLLNAHGHVDFRDARGPMRFTQRQAAGKFTRAEADGFIEQLQSTEPDAEVSPVLPQPAVRMTAAERTLQRVPDAALAAELQRRGWIVCEP